MESPSLIVMGGLPGTGKSSIAEALARHFRIPVFSVDPIEAAMWRGGLPRSQMTSITAYVVAETLAEEMLKLQLSAIIDAVNPVEAARASWRNLAKRQGARLKIVECLCSDREAHRRRLELRERNIIGMEETTWNHVEQRQAEYEPWTDERLTLNTTGDESFEALVERVIAYLKS